MAYRILRWGEMVERFKETTLWKKAFESEDASHHKTTVADLVHAFEKTRENAKVLVNEISVDLPTYTVHNIDYLDALWEVGSQITGAPFSINPVEGFILGCAFLLHDAAMTVAAYPQGHKQIRETREWKRLINRLHSTNDGRVDEKAAIEIFLREQHAVQAERLPTASWTSDGGVRYLIDNADYREKFGDFIGTLSASHWWSHSKVEVELQAKQVPAPAPFPSDWSIDLFKLACVLRTADAAQIDERRAPGFLRALRKNRLSDYSARHWTFQNKLTQPQSRGDTLYFAALRPFSKHEAREWWMLHDTLRMIDDELRKTDDLLARLRGDEHRFAARKVANLESPENLRSSVPTHGWRPVDTAFSISDIPRLIENLGGDQLYGPDSFVAVREVVQNAMDAVRLRRVIDPNEQVPLVEIVFEKKEDATYLVVRDNGVGMSEAEIVDNLLSFGKSGWLTDSAIGEYNDAFPSKSTVSGRYGIGFFSVFMLGHEVSVKSRRFDESPDQTVVLAFPHGLDDRPLLQSAEYTERMTNGGTEIKIHLNLNKLEERYWRGTFVDRFWADSGQNGANYLGIALARNFPTSDIPLRIVNGDSMYVVDGREWATEKASSLLARVEGESYLGEAADHYEKAMTPIFDERGTMLGRACVFPAVYMSRHRRSSSSNLGSIVSNGTHISGGNFRGVLLGTPIRAARDYARPVASHSAFKNWASEQARLLEPLMSDHEEQMEVAEIVASLGADTGPLKICEVGGSALSVCELREQLRGRNEIWIAHNAGVFLSGRGAPSRTRDNNTISVGAGMPSFIDTPLYPDFSPEAATLETVVVKIICEEFDIDNAIAEKWNKIENGSHVYRAQAPAWKAKGKIKATTTTGSYWKRSMTPDDVERFFIPVDKRQ